MADASKHALNWTFYKFGLYKPRLPFAFLESTNSFFFGTGAPRPKKGSKTPCRLFPWLSVLSGFFTQAIETSGCPLLPPPTSGLGFESRWLCLKQRRNDISFWFNFNQGLHEYSNMPNIRVQNHIWPWNSSRRLICATVLRHDLVEYLDISELWLSSAMKVWSKTLVMQSLSLPQKNSWNSDQSHITELRPEISCKESTSFPGQI